MAATHDRVFKPETLAIHAGQIPDAATGARALPIYQTTSFVFDSAEHAASLFNLKTFGNVYSRLSNPTVAALEERVAALEGGRAAVACASGMAAKSLALLTLLQTGDHVVAAGALYGGTVTMLAVDLKKFGIEVSFVDATKPEAFAAAMRPNTRAVYAESLGNPSLVVLDIAAVAAVAHANGVPLIVDNTVPSPALCNPIALGADIVIHSATKYLAGHGTTLAGVIVESGSFPWDNGKFPGMTEPSPGYHGVKFYETFGDFGFSMRCRFEGLRVFGPSLAPAASWQLSQSCSRRRRPGGSHPKVGTWKLAPEGRRPTGRLRRRAWLETVRAHHLGSHACKPSDGSPRRRRMASRSTTSATALSRPRYTAWCSSTRPASSPTPRPAPGPSCRASSRTSSTPSSSAASWRTASCGCAAVSAATTSCWRNSRKRRGFRPSCGARRMSQTAAHLVDHVIPHVPMRQWVLSLPIPLRLLLAAQPELVTAALQVVQSGSWSALQPWPAVGTAALHAIAIAGVPAFRSAWLAALPRASSAQALMAGLANASCLLGYAAASAGEETDLWLLTRRGGTGALEFLSRPDYATYLFRDDDDLPRLIEGLVRLPDFSREALYLPMEQLTGERADYAVAANDLPLLRGLRERLSGRKIHAAQR